MQLIQVDSGVINTVGWCLANKGRRCFLMALDGAPTWEAMTKVVQLFENTVVRQSHLELHLTPVTRGGLTVCITNKDEAPLDDALTVCRVEPLASGTTGLFDSTRFRESETVLQHGLRHSSEWLLPSR